jgi:hypothetical protein
LNKFHVNSGISLFIGENFYKHIDEKINNYIYPCELVKTSDRKKIVTIYKQFFFFDFYSTDENNLNSKDTKLKSLEKKENILNDRRKMIEMILNFNISSNNDKADHDNNHKDENLNLVDKIITDVEYEFFVAENYPQNLTQDIKSLFEHFKNNELNECAVIIRQIKKSEYFEEMNNNKFLTFQLRNIEMKIKNKIFNNIHSNSIDNYTININI